MVNLVYSCVFFQKSYIELIELLLKSYKLFGEPSIDTDYLVICSPSFKDEIEQLFDTLHMKGRTWCIDLHTKFEAGYSRLYVFDYPEIEQYEKIMYLDCDILITNRLERVFEIQLEDKLYALKEGVTTHEYWGGQFFENRLNTDGFSSGILLFNNCSTMRGLFQMILNHIKSHIDNGLYIPICLDQPFIVFHAIRNSLYNNTALEKIMINNPKTFQYELISHFPGDPGNYNRKINIMRNYMNDVMMIRRNDIEKVTIDDYKRIIHENRQLFDKLMDICIQSGEPVEGNSFTQHLNIHQQIPELIYKQMNHFTLGKQATNVMEIGFNAGHSSLLYLLANPNSKLTIFDLFDHKYTEPCFRYLQEVFPGRLRAFPGDSVETVYNFIQSHPDEKFDLIHIDGCHEPKIANKDFFHSFRLASSILIWDDTQISSLNDLFEDYMQEGYIQEVKLYDTQVYRHRICRVDRLSNRCYSWNDSQICFHTNYEMDAFGVGRYDYINDYLIKADFGGREHIIRFNDDYTKFISVRRGDFEVTYGDFVVSSDT